MRARRRATPSSVISPGSAIVRGRGRPARRCRAGRPAAAARCRGRRRRRRGRSTGTSDQAAEESPQHMGVAVPQGAGRLAPPEHAGLDLHGPLEVVRRGLRQRQLDPREAGGGGPQVQATEVRVAAEEADFVVDQAVELGQRVVARLGRILHPRHELRSPPGEDVEEEIVLVLEEGVDGPDRELGQLGDLLQRRVVEALGPEDLLGGIQELRAAQVLVELAALLAAALGRAQLPRSWLRRAARAPPSSLVLTPAG